MYRFALVPDRLGMLIIQRLMSLFSRTDVFKNSFFVRICRLLNELPLSLRESNILSIFRKFKRVKYVVNLS